MPDEAIEQALSLLAAVLMQPSNPTVKQFQNFIWDSEGSGAVAEVLGDLAYDLDFFEPDPKKRSEDPSFFDSNRVKSLVVEALEEISLIRRS